MRVTDRYNVLARRISTVSKLLIVVLLSLGSAAAATGVLLVSSGFDASQRRDHVVRTPEIEAAGGVAALTLLAGGLAVMRGRRPKKG